MSDRLLLTGVGLFICALGLFLVHAPKVSAAAASYPTQANKYISVSNAGNGINLTAPQSSIKMRFSGNPDYFRINIYDGKFKPGIDGGYNSSASTTFQVCASDASGEKSLSNCTAQFNANTFAQDQVIPIQRSGAPASFAHSLNIPSVNGDRILYLIARHTGPGLNGFKVSYANGFSNAAMTTEVGTTRIGFAGTQTSGGDYTMSLVHLPLSRNGRSNYTLTFQLPCNLGSAKQFRLRWYDADRPPTGIPYDTNISWSIRNNTSEQTRAASYYAGGNLNGYLGGNEQGKTQTVTNGSGFRVADGDTIVWTWSNVLNNNGVQFSLPYSEADVGVRCNIPTLDADCAVTGTGTSIPDEMIAGQAYQVVILLANVGSQQWLNGEFGITDHLGSGADSYSTDPDADPRTRRDNIYWSQRATQTGPVTTRLRLNSYPVPGRQGLASLRTATFWVTAPSVSTTQTVPFWFQMVHEERNSSGQIVSGRWFGDPCKKNIKIIVKENRPFIGVAGGDVVSGASFGSKDLSTQSCRPTTDSLNAGIKTNGYYGNALAPLLGNSMSQYAVLASGTIGDDSDYEAVNTFLGNYGHSDESTGLAKDMLFANLNIEDAQYGQYYLGSVSPQLPCVDVRSMEAQSTAPVSASAANTFLTSTDSGTRTVNTDLTLPASVVTIPAGTTKTLIVNGNVTIRQNITYGDSYANLSAVPYLRIIARNVYIQANAQRIDANLIALPRSDPGDASQQIDGVIDTCSNMTGAGPGIWPTAMTTTSCKRNPDSFVLNGQMIARRILWKRTNGTLSSKDNVADAACYYANYGDATSPPVITDDDGSGPRTPIDPAVERLQKCSAEFIKFNPEAYIHQFSDGVTVDGNIKSTVELPPVF